MDKRKQDEIANNFSLVLGGPLYQLYLCTGLVQPALQHVLKRIIFFTGITWLPLFLLSMISGTAFAHAQVPFYTDFSTHARFLLSLPLLIAAELAVHARVQRIVAQFGERGIISNEYEDKFINIISSCMRLRNSLLAEVLLIVIVALAGHWIWREFSVNTINTWYSSLSEGGSKLTVVGYWLVFVSMPIYQFIILRWYFRLFIWYKFLWQVSRLPLQLNSLHPDKSGGIGFIGNSVFAFGLMLVAHTVLLSGLILNRIWHTGLALPYFTLEIVGIILYLIVIILLPLTFFSLQLLRAKRVGTLAYGVTASRYVNDFRNKWIDGQNQSSQDILGTSDIQSLSDLANSYEVTVQMRILPFSKRNLVTLVVVLLLPLLPLLLTMMPIEEMIKNIFKIIF